MATKYTVWSPDYDKEESDGITRIVEDYEGPRSKELADPGYRNGLLDAIGEIESEMACADLEYADAEPARKAAYRVLFNAQQLIKDRIAMFDA